MQDLNGVFVFNVAEREYLDKPTARLIKEFDCIEGKLGCLGFLFFFLFPLAILFFMVIFSESLIIVSIFRFCMTLQFLKTVHYLVNFNVLMFSNSHKA